MNKRMMCATVMAIGGSVVLTGPTAGADPGPCRGNDREVVVGTGTESYDENGNGLICWHSGSNGRKPKGVGPDSYYYDDRV